MFFVGRPEIVDFWKVPRPPKAAQTPKIHDSRQAEKSRMKKPRCDQNSKMCASEPDGGGSSVRPVLDIVRAM
jgi:hypothetical protein